MTESTSSAREAAERNARAVLEGNFAQLMADITPEALAQMMQMAPPGATPGSFSLTSLPAITGYEIRELGTEADAEIFHVTFTSALGKATLSAAWKQVMGQWKITSVGLVGLEPAQETS